MTYPITDFQGLTLLSTGALAYLDTDEGPADSDTQETWLTLPGDVHSLDDITAAAQYLRKLVLMTDYPHAKFVRITSHPYEWRSFRGDAMSVTIVHGSTP